MQQHFLQSEKTAEAVAKSAEPQNKHVLEIGGGKGKITSKICEHASRTTVIEKDKELAQKLREQTEAQVIQGDFKKVDIPEFDACCSNPPFYLSSDILDFLSKKHKMSSLIVQKEFAEKIVCGPGNPEYSWRTVKTQLEFVPVKLRDISKNKFKPQPNCETSLLKLYPNENRHGIENKERFKAMIKPVFNNSRKKLRNSFVDSRHLYGISKKKAKKHRDDIAHSGQRVSSLGIQELSEAASDIEQAVKTR